MDGGDSGSSSAACLKESRRFRKKSGKGKVSVYLDGGGDCQSGGCPSAAAAADVVDAEGEGVDEDADEDEGDGGRCPSTAEAVTGCDVVVVALDETQGGTEEIVVVVVVGVAGVVGVSWLETAASLAE